jgi:hypothetical protein
LWDFLKFLIIFEYFPQILIFFDFFAMNFPFFAPFFGVHPPLLLAHRSVSGAGEASEGATRTGKNMRAIC